MRYINLRFTFYWQINEVDVQG